MKNSRPRKPYGPQWAALAAAIGPDGITCAQACTICGDINITAAAGRMGKHVRAGRLFKAHCSRTDRLQYFLTAADRDAWAKVHSKPAQELPLPLVGEGGPWGAGPMPAGWFSGPVRAWFGAYFRSDLLDPEGPHTVIPHNQAMTLAKQARQAREDGKGWAQGGMGLPGTLPAREGAGRAWEGRA